LTRPGAREHPPRDVEHEALPKAVVAGEYVEALVEVEGHLVRGPDLPEVQSL